MAENPISNDFEFLRNLSEEEQEKLAAGQNINSLSETNFFIQQTNINSTADNTLNVGANDVSSQNTTYSLSQTTIGASITLGLPNLSQGGNKWSNFFGNILGSLFR